MSFTEFTPERRIESLLDDASGITRAGALCSASGTLAGCRVQMAVTDPAVARGAIGAVEGEALASLFAQARRERLPVVLVLDSSGARVDEGLHALGAFRLLFREALHARLEGLRMVAVLGRMCFGGASMLACLCDRRVYLPATLLATSGPAVIEASAGRAAFDASDRDAIALLMGTPARLDVQSGSVQADDDLERVRAALQAALATAPGEADGLDAAHAALAARLGKAGLLPVEAAPATDPGRMSALLPPGYLPQTDGSMFEALPAAGSGKALFIGVMGGLPVTALACWRLAERLRQVQSSHAGSPIVLLLDAPGHAATVVDERLLLADFLVHLSMTIAASTHGGQRTVLWIAGAASGASYVAFAAPVERVSALPAARIEVLPAFAVRSIKGRDGAAAPAAGAAAGNPAAWIATGVADALLDRDIA